ncbi:MAG: LysR family transcriptional regulator [Minwuia sp.]|nr:LysR family transcriptional regulator [Minwuia sp.]
MRFTFDQIRTFLAIVREGGVRRASQSLHLTQPAITARIKNLEEALGVELFDRKATMALTKDGIALVSYAEQFLKLNDLIQRDVGRADSIDQLFRVGVSETIVQSWLPDFIAELRSVFPRLTVEIDVDISRNLRDRLLTSAIDFAILMGPVSNYRVENVHLPDHEIAWFCAPGHVQGLEPTEIFQTCPVISFARDTRPFRLLKEAFLERYGPGVVLFPSSSLSACFRLVASGLGVGALPLALAEPYLTRAEMERFDPGWSPEPLAFTASYLGSPESVVGARAAEIARTVAEAYDQNS